MSPETRVGRLRGVLPGAAALLAALCGSSGCIFTPMVMRAATRRTAPGELAGVLRDQEKHDIVLYRLKDMPGWEDGYYAFRIPPDWTSRPVRTRATKSGWDLMEMAAPMSCSRYGYGPVDADLPGGLTGIAFLDYRATLGQVVPNTLGRSSLVMLLDSRARVDARPTTRRYGVVRFLSEKDELVHELYGYDPARSRWVRLGSVGLGPWQARSRGTWLLLPPAIAADAVLWVGWAALILVQSMGGMYGGGSTDTIPPPIFFPEPEHPLRERPSPVPFTVR